MCLKWSGVRHWENYPGNIDTNMTNLALTDVESGTYFGVESERRNEYLVTVITAALGQGSLGPINKELMAKWTASSIAILTKTPILCRQHLFYKMIHTGLKSLSRENRLLDYLGLM